MILLFAQRKIKIRATTEEDIPEFDRTKVSLDIPKELFGEGFTLVTDLSKVLGSLITVKIYSFFFSLLIFYRPCNTCTFLWTCVKIVG